MMTDHEVTLVQDSMLEFYVKFKGPKESGSSPILLRGPLSPTAPPRRRRRRRPKRRKARPRRAAFDVFAFSIRSHASLCH